MSLEINVAYDTRDKRYYEDFKKVCDEHDVELHLHLSEPGGSPSFYHAQTAKWAYENLIKGGDDCIAIFLDHYDMFLIDDFNPTEEMSNNDVMGCLQSREDINYIYQVYSSARSPLLKMLSLTFSTDSGWSDA